MTSENAGITATRRTRTRQGLLRRQIVPIVSFGVAISLCEYLVVTGVEPGTLGYWYSVLSFSAFPLLASIECVRASSKLEGGDRQAWRLIALACFSMFCAETFWAYLEINFSENIPMTAMATIGYVVSPVFFVLGMLLYQDRVRSRGFTLVQIGSLGVVFSSVVYGYLLVVYRMLESVGLDAEVVITSLVQGIFILSAPVIGTTVV